MVFAILYRPGPAWDPERTVWQQPLEAHGDYQYGLWSEGRLLHGGPFSDGSGGLSVIEAPDADAARAIVDADPAVRSGLFLADLRPWFPVDWATYEPSDRA